VRHPRGLRRQGRYARSGTGARGFPLTSAFGAALGYPALRLGVVARGDVLVVRNNFRSRTVARKDMEGFRLGSPSTGGFPTGRAIQALP